MSLHMQPFLVTQMPFLAIRRSSTLRALYALNRDETKLVVFKQCDFPNILFFIRSILQADAAYNYPGEVNNLVAALANPAAAQANGIKVGGVKYMYIRSNKDENTPEQFLVGNKVIYFATIFVCD